MGRCMTTREELEELTKEIRNQAYEMKRNLAVLERSYFKPSVEELLDQGHKWQRWFAWKPVRDIHGNWHWLKEIFRMRGNTYVDHENWTWYHYGTIFDVIKNGE